MKEKALTKWKRSELLELLLAQSQEIDDLRAQVAALQAELARREIILSEAGSIAEAALRLNQVFEQAQAAADQYLENVKRAAAAPKSAVKSTGKGKRRGKKA